MGSPIYSASAVKERKAICFGGVEIEWRLRHFTRSNHFGQQTEIAIHFGCIRSFPAETHWQRSDALLASLGLNLNDSRLVFVQLSSADWNKKWDEFTYDIITCNWIIWITLTAFVVDWATHSGYVNGHTAYSVFNHAMGVATAGAIQTCLVYSP